MSIQVENSILVFLVFCASFIVRGMAKLWQFGQLAGVFGDLVREAHGWYSLHLTHRKARWHMVFSVSQALTFFAFYDVFFLVRRFKRNYRIVQFLNFVYVSIV